MVDKIDLGGLVKPCGDAATQPQGSFRSASVNFTAISANAVRRRSNSALASSSSWSRAGLSPGRSRLRKSLQSTVTGDVFQLGDRRSINTVPIGRVADRGLATHQPHPNLILLLRRQKPLVLPWQ